MTSPTDKTLASYLGSVEMVQKIELPMEQLFKVGVGVLVIGGVLILLTKTIPKAAQKA